MPEISPIAVPALPKYGATTEDSPSAMAIRLSNMRRERGPGSFHILGHSTAVDGIRQVLLDLDTHIGGDRGDTDHLLNWIRLAQFQEARRCDRLSKPG